MSTAPLEHINEAHGHIRAALHGHVEALDDPSGREALRSLLWLLSEATERVTGNADDRDLLRQVGDRLTGDEGAAERVAQLMGRARTRPAEPII